MGNGEWIHPCLSCGACCAKYRVSFDWAETLPHSFAVPRDMIDQVSPQIGALKFTAKNSFRCQALGGKIGEQVACRIYENRPSPCRQFRASFEDGTHHSRCDECRAGLGLRPLRSEDWPQVDQNIYGVGEI